jgi:pilus retraction protein PilT
VLRPSTKYPSNQPFAGWKQRRDRAMQLVMLCAGLRVSEVIDMQIDAIDSHTATLDGSVKLCISTKPKYDRTTYLRVGAVPEVLAWLDERKTMNIPGMLLFPASLEGQSLDKATVYRQVNATFKRAGIAVMRTGGRTLRNTFAAQELKSGSTTQELTQLLEFARRKEGFFLVTGPVGQGKSTTLAAMVSLINNESKRHVITVEDPIEFIFKQDKALIEQREVGVDTKDFYSALVSALRQDVDVLMIGEMRDKETIAAAVTAAETGHLVLSTLHTNSASQTVDRIIDSFPSDQQDQIRAQLAGSLLGIISQRLIPRVSGGLIPAYELLINTPAVANLIRERRTHEIDVLIETGKDQGMIDLNRCLADLVRQGEILPDTALERSRNPLLLKRLLGS